MLQKEQEDLLMTLARNRQGTGNRQGVLKEPSMTLVGKASGMLQRQTPITQCTEKSIGPILTEVGGQVVGGLETLAGNRQGWDSLP